MVFPKLLKKLHYRSLDSPDIARTVIIIIDQKRQTTSTTNTIAVNTKTPLLKLFYDKILTSVN